MSRFTLREPLPATSFPQRFGALVQAPAAPAPQRSRAANARTVPLPPEVLRHCRAIPPAAIRRHRDSFGLPCLEPKAPHRRPPPHDEPGLRNLAAPTSLATPPAPPPPRSPLHPTQPQPCRCQSLRWASRSSTRCSRCFGAFWGGARSLPRTADTSITACWSAAWATGTRCWRFSR